jgi:hypothetical protein
MALGGGGPKLDFGASKVKRCQLAKQKMYLGRPERRFRFCWVGWRVAFSEGGNQTRDGRLGLAKLGIQDPKRIRGLWKPAVKRSTKVNGFGKGLSFIVGTQDVCIARVEVVRCFNDGRPEPGRLGRTH